MRQVAIIPARFGSSRFPGKPLALILGKPLIQWTYERALQVKDLDGVWVATDDGRIKECVESFGGRAVMTRDDHPSGSDRLAEAATLLNLAPEDIVVNIQGDQPVFPPDLICQLCRGAAPGPRGGHGHPDQAGERPRGCGQPQHGQGGLRPGRPRPLFLPQPPAFLAGRRRPRLLPPHRHLRLPGAVPPGIRAPAPRPLGGGGEAGAAPGPGARLCHSPGGDDRGHPGGGHARRPAAGGGVSAAVKTLEEGARSISRGDPLSPLPNRLPQPP